MICTRPKQKLRRTASPLYGGSAFLAYGHAAQDKKAPCLPVSVLCFSLALETKAAPNRFAALSRLSVSRIRPRGTRQKSTLFAVGRTLFLARARNKSCAEPLRRSMATQRFSHTATRYKTKKHPVCRWPYFVSRSRSKQKLRRTTSPLYGGSAFLAGDRAACKKTDPVWRGLFFWCRWPDSNRHGIATGGF